MSRNEELWRLEEDFHKKDQKSSRKERKLATAQDRSKFKKTDQDQLRKNKQGQEENLFRGRILSIDPDGIRVLMANETLFCHLRGSLKQEKSRMKNLIAVGDFVFVQRQDPHPGLISSIEKRSSVLSRADNLSRNKEQLIAVNVDQVLITVAVVMPALKLFLIDRYIIAAQKGNMAPIIVVNKTDLLTEHPEEKELFDAFLALYRSLHFHVIPVSIKTGEGIEELKEAMKGKTSVFSGPSGVGKSSLINLTTGTSLATGSVVHRTNKGSHTTTTTHLVPLEGGGFCIDTPGIKSFGIWDLQLREIATHFADISALSAQCKFHDCSHQSEPGCAVKLAVEQNIISPLRFASYSALMLSAKEKHTHR